MKPYPEDKDSGVEWIGGVLKESDGPMLRHGLQGLHHSRLVIPRIVDLPPDSVLLSRRWERFEKVA